MATDVVPPISMQPDELHCTIFVSPEPIPFYHDKFLSQPYDLVRVDELY